MAPLRQTKRDQKNMFHWIFHTKQPAPLRRLAFEQQPKAVHLPPIDEAIDPSPSHNTGMVNASRKGGC